MLGWLRHRWKNTASGELVALAAGMALCVSVWLFIWVAAEINERDHQAAEEKWMLALRRPDNPAVPIGPKGLEEVARDLSALGGATVIVLLATFVSGYLWLQGRWRRVLLLGVTIAGGHVLSHTLKALYGRERPSVVPHLAYVDSHSFPSGHSLSSSVIYLTIAALLAQSARRRGEKMYLMAVAFVLIFLIGASRVFLGVHYPSDVVAGWSAGMAWALACWIVANRLRRRTGENRQRGA